MPNRYVREDAIESEPVNSLTWQAEVFWRRLINRADDFGRYTAHNALLRSNLFPMQLDKVREADMPRLLAECEKAGLLFRYMAEGKQLLVMNKWERGRAKESKYPPPPPDVCERMQTYVYTSLQMSPIPIPIPIPTLTPTLTPTLKTVEPAKPAPTAKVTVCDDIWLESLSADTTYQGINVLREFGKMKNWCENNRKKPSRARFINWLNRIEKPMDVKTERELSIADYQ